MTFALGITHGLALVGLAQLEHRYRSPYPPDNAAGQSVRLRTLVLSDGAGRGETITSVFG